MNEAGYIPLNLFKKTCRITDNSATKNNNW